MHYRVNKTFVLSLAISLAGVGTVGAQESDLGRDIFNARCAMCHGTDVSGNGIIGELFAVKPRNLTKLALENNGAFPFSEVYQSIDGRREIAGHGDSPMPVWGDYFMQSAVDNPAINEKDASHVTQGRILSVVYYLQGLQAP